MKTTIELPDELLAEAKEVVRVQRTTFRELFTEGLRRELERRTQDRPRADFVFPTFGDGGMRPDVSPSDWREISYGDRG